MSDREEFEAAMLEMEHPHFGFLGNEYLAKEGEEYLDVYMQGLWIGWQSSRAGLVVELPYCFETYGYSAEVARVATDGCAEAIENAGITVRRTE
ncbi:MULTISPECIES: hypothetical protein [Pseudomonas]|uniref:Uncharacterized protein n=1 Tax=Pseudomonas luteola TaxID=47886 RepID=A0ABS0FPM2_PSELU|nr:MULTISPECIES: hypothetical protein [Pseudomonas]MBF8642308.1 hypothetical protein [Pseudomonas zeshuii]SHJ23507.1 hypothetical protein SAMN05216295_109185 [Pseudomonas zeshuii]